MSPMDSAESDFLSEIDGYSKPSKFPSELKEVSVSNNGAVNNQHKKSDYNFGGAALLSLPEGISGQQFRLRRRYSGSRNY